MLDDDWMSSLGGVAVVWHGPGTALPVNVQHHAAIHVALRGEVLLSWEDGESLPLESGAIVLSTSKPSCDSRLHLNAGEGISAFYASSRGASPLAGRPGIVLDASEVRRARGLSTVTHLLRMALLNPSPGQDRLAQALLAPLLAYVRYAHTSRSLGSQDVMPLDECIERAVQLLKARPAKAWTVEKLARAVGLSRAPFARRFQAELGQPPLRYLTELRMRLAERLLEEGSESLAAIAEQVGYESEFAFSRAFKRYTGESPGVYRRRAQTTLTRPLAIRAAA